MKNSKLVLRGLLNSLGVFVYVMAVALIMTNGDRLFGQVDTIWADISFLLLFVLSALIVSLLLLGQPIYLFLSGAKKDSVKLLVSTAIFMILITASTMVIYSAAK